MRLVFLLLLVISVTSVPSSQIVGGYTEVTDKQSAGYTNSVSFVAAQFPELASWNVVSVQSQVVNGMNYLVTLQNSGNNAQVKVYSTFAGVMTVSQYTLNSVPQPLPQSNQNANGVTVINNLSIDPSTSSPSVTDVSGSTSSSGGISITSNTVSDVYSISSPLILDNFFIGGYRQVPLSENSSFSDAWNSVVDKYTYLSGYDILEVRRQVVAGLNYIFVAESSQKNKIVVIKVYQSLSHQYTINIIQTNTAVGYSAEEILAFQKKCIELKPQLANYQLVYISNSQVVSGISFTFVQDSNYVIADCSYQGGNLIVTFQ